MGLKRGTLAGKQGSGWSFGGEKEGRKAALPAGNHGDGRTVH